MANRQRFLEQIKRFRLLDDDFMNKVFAEKECAELLLHIILEKDDLTVTKVEAQAKFQNLRGRSVILDILATDENGVLYNVEVQRSAEGANPRRARYHSAMLDANVLPSGQDFRELPETYVIFITETDVLKHGYPIYTIDRTISQLGESFGDGAHILYVNASYEGDSPIGLLMQDFRERDPKAINYEALRKVITHYKESEEGVNSMCEIMENIFQEGRKGGVKEGIQEGIVKSLRNLMKNTGVTADEALKMLSVPQDEWENYRKLLNS